MPFNNDIAGGNGSLVRNWLQSIDYVAGVNGWRISKDGSAEFNNGTFRGSIEVGSLTGQHFIVNNPATGDVIDIYNTANKLVFTIDNTGRVVSTSSATNSQAVLAGGSLLLEDSAESPQFPPFISGHILPDSTSMTIEGGIPADAVAFAQPSFISLNTGDALDSAYIFALQRNIQGTILQNDNAAIPNGNQIVHMDIYSATVAGGAGLATFNHNCQFTPTGGIVAALTNFSQWNWHDSFGTHGFTSTQAQIMPFFPNGASLGNGQVITFAAMFWG